MTRRRNRKASGTSRAGSARSPNGDPAASPHWVEHPEYGAIPYYVPSGYDLDYQPALPRGALRGDPRRQRGFCSHCRPPRYFYADQRLRCRLCHQEFVWPAARQRHWFEVLGLSAAAPPPARCPDCALAQRRLAEASESAARCPDQATALLGLAEAIVRHRERLGTGDLNRAIHCARQAARIDPAAWATHYWEGVCHEIAGRAGRAVECYDRLLGGAGRDERSRPLVEAAARRRAGLVLLP